MNKTNQNPKGGRMKKPITPGKWQSAESMSGKLLIVAETEPGFQQTIAELKSKSANVAADAMLLRSAPQLLAIVEFLNEFLKEGCHQVSFHALATDDDETTLADLIKATLANVRGRQTEDAEGFEDVGRNGWKIDGRGD